MSPRTLDPLWDVLCPYRNALYVLFVLGVLLFVLNLVSVLSLDALTRGSRVLLWVNGTLTLGLVLGSGYVLVRCTRAGDRPR